jgi:hypothetical protein
LVDKGADIAATDDSGRTPLDMARAGTHLQVVSYLASKTKK